MNFKKLFKKKKVFTHTEDPVSKLRFGITIASFLLVTILFIFLYRNFYQTIVQARLVIVLQQEVALQNVDIKAYNAVYAQHQFKQSYTLPPIIADPFNASALPTEEQEVDATQE